MSEKEIQDRLVSIIGMLQPIHEDKIELICQTIAIIESEQECINGLSTLGERLFFKELADSFIYDCVLFMYSKGCNSRKMGNLLGIPQQRIQTLYGKLIRNLSTERPPSSTWKLDKDGRIAPDKDTKPEKKVSEMITEPKPPEPSHSQIPEGVCEVRVKPDIFDMVINKMVNTPPAKKVDKKDDDEYYMGVKIKKCKPGYAEGISPTSKFH